MKLNPTCQVLSRCDCGSPPEIANTEVMGDGTTFGSLRLYTCEEGFTPSGNRDLSECLADGSWSTVNIQCTIETTTYPYTTTTT
ncbi:hypothetical protein ScPMuIL_011240 [Solemya velum]